MDVMTHDSIAIEQSVNVLKSTEQRLAHILPQCTFDGIRDGEKV